MTRRTSLRLILIITVITTISVIPPILRRLNTVPLALSSRPDFVTTPEKAIALNSNPCDVISLLALTEKENGFTLSLQAYPVDPTTLANLPGYTAMDFGHHYNYKVSPCCSPDTVH